MRLLALTGSLRARSINTELLRAVALVAPPDVSVTFSDALGQLPHFNPDLDQEGMAQPATVTRLRGEVADADAVIISCPEYAHGIAGSFKNLLDWLVSSSEMPGKPICVLNASTSSRFGPASLVEILKTMSTLVVTGDAVTVPVDGRRMDAAAIAADAELRAVLDDAIAAIAAAVAAPRIRDDFLRAALAPRTGSHASGTLAIADALLTTHANLATHDIYVAATLGNADAVRQFLDANPSLATATSAPYGWDALTCLCFSRYLRLDDARSAGFVDAARALLDAGASANTGFFEKDHTPAPEFESVLYGAAGVAHHEGVTRLLLERGADPNDNEVPYHSPEGYDLRALRAILDSGRVTPETLTMMLLRKSDWHDRDGMQLVLERGADANAESLWGTTPLRHAIRSDNSAAIVTLLLDHGADATRPNQGMTPYALAAWAGRKELLELFDDRGQSVALHGLDALVEACARQQGARALQLVEAEPTLLPQLRERGAKVLVRFAGVGNSEGLECLLDLGLDVNAADPDPNGYFELAAHTTALHIAAWRGRHATVRFLIGRGADVNLRDAAGRSALSLAVRACVDSYWTDSRAPDSVAMLLDAGASVAGARFPSGYDEVDVLLRAHGATNS